MRKYMLFALACAIATPAAAADWRVMNVDGESEIGGLSVAFVDLDTLERRGDDVRFVMQVRFSTSPAGQWDSLRALVHVDCPSRRWESLESGLWLGEEKVRDFGPTPMAETQPDTNGYRVVESVCNARYESGPVEPAEHARTIFTQ